MSNQPTIREALLAMGYQERKPGSWLKPVGHHGFTYHEGKNEWANWFYDATGKVALWETKAFEADTSYHGNYIVQIQHYECYTRTGMAYGPGFELFILDL